MMQFTIAGTEAEIVVVTFSEIDFGKQAKGLIKKYVLKVPWKGFNERFGPIYAAWVTELIRDDGITGEFHPPYTGAMRYPSFEEFLSLAERQRMDMISTYFVFDILRLYVREDASAAEWRINSLDSLKLERGVIYIGGQLIKRQGSTSGGVA